MRMWARRLAGWTGERQLCHTAPRYAEGFAEASSHAMNALTR